MQDIKTGLIEKIEATHQHLASEFNTIRSGGANAAQSMLLIPWALSGGMPITPAMFQMIVGIYMLETAILLSLFLNRIQYGDDVVGERSLMSKTIIISIIVYVISWLVVYSMFGNSISGLLTTGI